MIITDRFYRRGTFLGLHAMAIKWAILIIGNHNNFPTSSRKYL